MPSSGVFQSTTSVDLNAAVYGIELLEDAGASGGDFRAQSERFFFASRVVLQSGGEPSYAVAEIPLTQFEETAPAIAGVRGGALEGVKIGTRALVFVHSPAASAPLLAGSVVNIQHDLGSDGATLTIFDDRWLLRGVPVVGQFVYDPESQGIAYRQRGPARFNPQGRANCLDSPLGPMFAPYPDYGRDDGDSDPSPGAALLAARPWRLSDIAAYLRRTLCTADLSAQTAAFDWFQRVDSSRLLVPDSFGQELDADAADPDDSRARAGFTANDREAGASGKAPDVTLEGLDLLAALTRIVESAGAYALNCSASEEQTLLGGRQARSLLEIVPTRFIEGAACATSVLRPAGGEITASAGRIGVVDGQLEEDGSDVFTSIVVAGEPVQLEFRAEYLAAGGGAGLERAWSAEDETAFRAYVRDHPDHPGTHAAFREACWKFPRVFAAYHVPADYDYLSDTKYAGFPRVTPHPPLAPQLLTALSERISGSKRRRFAYPLTVELKDGEGVYRAQSLLDGLQVDDDGTLWLNAHREAGLYDPENGTWQGDLADPDTLEPRDLRLTLALQMDHRVCTALRLAVGAAGTEAGATVADPGGDAGRVASGLARQYFADVGGAYREHLRRDAWPIPESVHGSSAAADRATLDHELASDAARAKVHAQRRLAEVGRARRTARLVFPSAMLWKPGQAVSSLRNRGQSGGDFPVRGAVVRVTHVYESNTTEIELN